MPLQFTYSERCHYNSFEPSNMLFSTYLILLDPRAGSGIFVWTKMPLLPLHPPLTYLWAPHVSFFFFFPSPAAVAALHPQALARTPGPVRVPRPHRRRWRRRRSSERRRRRRQRVRPPRARGGPPAEAERASSLGSAGEPRGRAVRGPRPRSTAPFGVRARARRPPSPAPLRPAAPRRARPCGAPPPRSARARRRRGLALAGAADTPAPPSGARARREQRRASLMGEQRRAASAGRRSWRREEGAGTRREDSPALGRLRARARRPMRQVQAPAWG